MINLYMGIFLIGILISSMSQIILKKSAIQKHENMLKEYLNVQVIGAYAIFVLATFCSIYAYKGVPLSLGPILEATQYIFVAILSHIFLKENISKRKQVGLITIFIGVIIFSL